MMKNQEKQNHMKKPFLCYIDGPIFFTAPHSKKLNRGGPEYKQKKRIHLRQIYTSYLACKMSNLTGSNSFCVWGKSSVINDQDLDPNYLLQKMFQSNSFHQSLHYWGIKNKNKPLLHVDIHGKMNRQTNSQIDVGIVPMQVHWNQDPLIGIIKNFFIKQLNPIFSGKTFNGFQCKFNVQPDLHGYWGNGIHTMTDQAAKLGIPSFQLEIPKSVRQQLFKDQKLLLNFSLGIKRLYQEVILPYKVTKQLKVDKKLYQMFKQTLKNQKQRQQCQKQIYLFEQKEKQNLNVKKI